MSRKLNGHSERGASGAAAGVDAAAPGVAEPAAGVVDDVAAGTFSVGRVNSAAGIFSSGTVGPAAVVSLDVVPPSVGAGALVLCAGGVSMLPRMSGKPSLALPITTTFEFVDCAS